jgi:hypothetical protein
MIRAMNAPKAPSVETPSNRLRILWPLAVPFAVLLGVFAFANLQPSKHTIASRPGALVWGDGIFASTTELHAWLRLHGGSYHAWVRQHPQAFRLMTAQREAKATVTSRHTPERVSIRRGTTPAARRTDAVAGAKKTIITSPVGTTSSQRSLTALLLVIFAVLVLSGALLPGSWLRQVGSAARVLDIRIGLAAAGVALLSALALALAFG